MTEHVTAGIPGEAWECAFLRVGVAGGYGRRPVRWGGGRPAALDYDALVADAAANAGINAESEAIDVDPEESVRDVLEKHEMGTVGISFPESTHGDAVWIAVSRFPGGTAVGLKTTSYGPEQVVFILPRATFEAVTDAAEKAIYAEQDGADWGVSDEDDDVDEAEREGASAVLFGFEALAEAWKRPSKAGQRRP